MCIYIILLSFEILYVSQRHVTKIKNTFHKDKSLISVFNTILTVDFFLKLVYLFTVLVKTTTIEIN